MFCETNNEEAVFEQLIVQGDERLFLAKEIVKFLMCRMNGYGKIKIFGFR